MPSATFQALESIGLITLNRPDVRNAVDLSMLSALEEILGEVDERSELRALILTGAGRGFCAGGDLNCFAGLKTLEEGRAFSRRMTEVLRRLADGPRPVIAAVGGDAFGGGCEVLVACHLRLATPTARFSFRQAAMGVVTGWGGGARLFELLGRSQALRLLLSAETIDAAEAVRIGLLNEVVEERLMDQALELARKIAANAPESIMAFLELSRLHASAGGAAVEQREAELFAQGFVGDHFRSRLAEWTRKR